MSNEEQRKVKEAWKQFRDYFVGTRMLFDVPYKDRPDITPWSYFISEPATILEDILGDGEQTHLFAKDATAWHLHEQEVSRLSGSKSVHWKEQT